MEVRASAVFFSVENAFSQTQRVLPLASARLRGESQLNSAVPRGNTRVCPDTAYRDLRRWLHISIGRHPARNS